MQGLYIDQVYTVDAHEADMPGGGTPSWAISHRDTLRLVEAPVSPMGGMVCHTDTKRGSQGVCGETRLKLTQNNPWYDW